MKKIMIFFVLLIFLVSFVFSITSFVIANNETNQTNNQGNETNCTENWSCTNWSDCVNETQIRTCTDLNDCNTTNEKPEETQDCEISNQTTCTTDGDCETGYECENFICVLEDNGNQTQHKKTVVTKTITRIEKRIEFKPWQKRNESECQEGCKCQGAVMMCRTENGKEITIEAGRSGNIITITIEKIGVETELEIESEVDEENNSTKIKVKMSNGQKKEIKQLPNNIRQRVREQVKICIEDEDKCEMKLKEIRDELMYEVEGEKQSKLFNLFKKRMHIKTQVNAETGEIMNVNKPWWAFLASEE